MTDPAELASFIFDLARHGDTDRLAAYVEAGAPVNMQNGNGDTCLMLAAYSGHEATVKKLLELGADHAILNDRGQSVLAGAVFKKETGIISLLLQAGADPDLGTPTARQTAEMFGVPLSQ